MLQIVTLLSYQWPSMVPCDMPSQTTITDEIYSKSLHVKGLLSKKFKVLDSRVSFTFDAGTSRAFDPYLTVTGHWINVELGKDMSTGNPRGLRVRVMAGWVRVGFLVICDRL
jgi:hypothetical protein